MFWKVLSSEACRAVVFQDNQASLLMWILFWMDRVLWTMEPRQPALSIPTSEFACRLGLSKFQ